MTPARLAAYPRALLVALPLFVPSRKRYLVGAVLPISLPEYFRWSVELFRDSYQSASMSERNGLATRLQVAF